MGVRTRVVSCFRTLTRGARLDAELDAELRAHVDLLTDENVQAGMPPETARRAALLEVGGVEQVKERVRDVRVGAWVETLALDFRYAGRALRRTPAVTATAVASLALGIGLNAAIFSIVHAVLLQPLPYAEPDRLTLLSEKVKEWDNGPIPPGFSPADYLDVKREATSFTGLAAYASAECTLQAGSSTRTGTCLRVSAEYFPVLGVPAARGRYFVPEEDRPDADVVVLSDAAWKQRFGASTDVVGRDVAVNGRPHRIVGIMPPSFHAHLWAKAVDMWLPYAFAGNPSVNRRMYTISVIGRLKPGVTIENASAEVDRIMGSLAAQYRGPYAGVTVTGGWARPLVNVMATPARDTLLLCWAAMALVLAVTCTNVAGLLLARTETRRRELAIRASLGAGRGRLARQLMIESFVLALSGAVVGLVLASWSGPLLIQLIPEASLMTRLDEAGLNPSVLGFTIVLACVTCGLFGLAPAWRGCSTDLRAGLTENARTATESRTGVRLRGGVQVVQLALTVVLLAGAGLMVRSISHLYRVPLGFDADRLLTVRSQFVRGEPFSRDLGVRPAGNAPGQMMHQWALTERALRFPEEAIRRVRQVPGVESAAMAVMGLPMYRTFWYDFAVDGKPMPAPGQPSPIGGEFWAVTPSYFATMGIGVEAGRALRGSDTVGRPRVAVINHYMARTVWPKEANVVGRRVATDNDAGYEIVGVVRDVRVWPVEERSNQVYVALAQHVQPYYEDFPASFRLGFDLIVRTSGDPRALGPAVTDALARAEPAAPIDDVLPYSSVVSATFGPWRSTLWLFGLNGALALALSAIGLYGMVSFSVTQRTREIGIRVALGASGAAVVRLMLGRALRLAAMGLCFGMVAAFWGNRLVANRLYGVTANDPVTLVGVAIVLLGVAAVATWLPARRAAGVDPADTLRVE